MNIHVPKKIRNNTVKYIVIYFQTRFTMEIQLYNSEHLYPLWLKSIVYRISILPLGVERLSVQQQQLRIDHNTTELGIHFVIR